MTEPDLESQLLRHVNHPNYRPVKPRVIAKQLDLPEELHRDLKKTLKRLVKKGKIGYGKNHLVQSVKMPRADEIVGRFTKKTTGFGFVHPDGVEDAKDRREDVFIPAKQTKDAASGDLVRATFSTRKSRDGDNRMSGEIIEVIERARDKFVGTYFEESNLGFVKIDGPEFQQPVFVGDPGAKRVDVNDKVIVEMVKFPTTFRKGEGVITEVLGKKNAPGVDTRSIICEFSLPQDFPEEVLAAARGQADAFDESIGEHRVDLTDLVVVTIDPKDARDFDDAISLERLDNGHLKLGVHIADVAHFVPVGSELDIEAKDRATSVYLPDLVIPMLPEIISNSLASLQPNRVRYAKTAFIEFTEEGIRIGTEFCTSAIRSNRRFTYEEVDEFLKDRNTWKEKLEPAVYQLVGDMHSLAMKLRERRLARGSIELNLPEVKLELDKSGKVKNAKKVERTESHQVIEEFMLAANEAVAERLSDDELLFLRRIHEPPDPKKLKKLTEFVNELKIECESLESRFEIKRVLEAVANEPDEAAVNFAVLRSMQKAVYSPTAIGHYALGSQNYCHFTSPIRRYPDLTIHRTLEKIFRGEPAQSDFTVLATLGEHCSEREQRAEAAERELTKVKLLTLLAGRIGQSMEAVITGVEDFGLFAQGTDLPAEGLVSVKSLDDDRYFYDSTTHSLTGHRAGNSYRIGDLVTVEIAKVDLDRRELDFRILKKEKSIRSKESKRSKDVLATPRRKSKKKTKKSKRKRH